MRNYGEMHLMENSTFTKTLKWQRRAQIHKLLVMTQMLDDEYPWPKSPNTILYVEDKLWKFHTFLAFFQLELGGLLLKGHLLYISDVFHQLLCHTFQKGHSNLHLIYF